MTLHRLAYAPRHLVCYALVAVAIPVVVGIFTLIAVLGVDMATSPHSLK